MAQSVEHVIGNDEVISSILITSSKSLGYIPRDFCFDRNNTLLGTNFLIAFRDMLS